MIPTPEAPSPQRLRQIQILTVVILLIAFGATVIFLFDPVRRAQLEAAVASPFGLVVLFILSIISNATLILPVPGIALTAIAATAASPLAVGLVAGLGQAIGELTGYLAGYSGQELVDESPRYGKMVNWMRRYGLITIFVLALIPNPFFDIAGIVAGALRMPIWQYFISAASGKIIKNLALAYAASEGLHWIMRYFGG